MFGLFRSEMTFVHQKYIYIYIYTCIYLFSLNTYLVKWAQQGQTNKWAQQGPTNEWAQMNERAQVNEWVQKGPNK